MNSEQKEHEIQRERCNRAELVELFQSAMPNDGKTEPIEGLTLLRSSSTAETVHGVVQPSLCVIAQGSKEIFLGDERFQYDPYTYLLATIEVPVIGRVLEASEEEPYFAIALALDAAVVGSVLVEIGQTLAENQEGMKGLVVSPLDTFLLDAVLRLLRLYDSPVDARLLHPLIMKEIIYRLLTGPQGLRLSQMTVMGGNSHRISKAIGEIRNAFDKILQVKDLAEKVGMSVSSFHHHFKDVTAMSPLQFQKHLRLQEARRLMLGENLDAAHAGYNVGYEDASHFNRDYKRHFGVPPLKDVERLRKETKAHSMTDYSKPRISTKN